MSAEEELHNAWIATRTRVLKAIDAELGSTKTPAKVEQVLDLAEAYAWLTRPDQSHDRTG